MWPAPTVTIGDQDDAALAALYGYPDGLDRPWLRVNFVSSVDGSATLDGRSDGLSSSADKRVFGLLRALADVILVGAGTARAENYRGARWTRRYAELRRELGLSPVAPIAVVTSTAELDPTGPLFTDTHVAPIVLACEETPEQRRAELGSAGARVLLAGERTVDPKLAIAALGEIGLNRMLCEGGPRLFANLVAADVVDELCLTLAPALASGPAHRIAHGKVETPRRLRLASTLLADDDLLLRYTRETDSA